MILLVEIAAEVSYLDLLMKGGWLMIPLFLLSFIAIYIFFERLFFINGQKKADVGFLKDSRTL